MLAFKILFSLCFAASLIGGIYLLKNFNRLLGRDPNVPSENESSLLLNRSQVVLIWLLSMKLFGMMAIML